MGAFNLFFGILLPFLGLVDAFMAGTALRDERKGTAVWMSVLAVLATFVGVMNFGSYVTGELR